MLPGTGALFRVRKNRPKKDVTRSDGRDDEMGRKKERVREAEEGGLGERVMGREREKNRAG